MCFAISLCLVKCFSCLTDLSIAICLIYFLLKCIFWLDFFGDCFFVSAGENWARKWTLQLCQSAIGMCGRWLLCPIGQCLKHFPLVLFGVVWLVALVNGCLCVLVWFATSLPFSYCDAEAQRVCCARWVATNSLFSVESDNIK